MLYKDKRLDYFIFQFAGKFIVDIIRAKYIIGGKSIFFNPIDEKLAIMRNSEHEKKIELQKLVLNKPLDFFPMRTYLNDDIVSERLKQAIEDMGITGFEFSEVDYEVVVE